MLVAPDFARVMAGDQPDRSEAYHDEADNQSHDIDPARHYEIAPVPVTPLPHPRWKQQRPVRMVPRPFRRKIRIEALPPKW